MKYVLRYENGDAPPELAQQHFPAHRARWDEFRQTGSLLAIGPSTDGSGAMAVLTSQAAAEEFAVGDPFVLQGSGSGTSRSGWRRSSAPDATASHPEHGDEGDYGQQDDRVCQGVRHGNRGDDADG
jgi:uncharacterized protein YciI